jgi:hypothetical protein
MLPEPIPDYGLMTTEAEPKSLDTKLSLARLGRVDWIDELLNWITKFEMIIVALTLISMAAPCDDAPTRQGIQEVKANSIHTMKDTCQPPSLYIETGDWTHLI